MEPRWRALAILTAARTSMGVQFQSIASVSPVLVPELGLSYGDLGFLIGLYFLPGVIMALPAGSLGRRFGDTRTVAVGLVLMVTGGIVTSVADSTTVLTVGRTLSGIGAVLLNVLMTKMVTDWFAGREIMLAMAVFMNSFPIGVGLALLSLGWLATATGWATALLVSALFASAALLLLVTSYVRHPNDGAAAPVVRAGSVRFGAVEALLVCVAGAIWGIFNGTFSVIFGFAPTFLSATGLSPAEAGLIVGAATWLVAASVQTGGMLAQKWARPASLVTIVLLAWAGCLFALASGYGPPGAMLLAIGLLTGLPVGVITSLPAQALRPENRAVGMGLCYFWVYLGQGGLPPVAGWIQDRTGSPAAPLHFTAALVLAMLLLFWLFRLGMVARARTAADAPAAPRQT
jgi:cyanate permease